MKRLILAATIFTMAALPAMAGHKHGRHGKHYHHRPVYAQGYAPAYAPVYAAAPYGWYAPDVAVLQSFYGPRYYAPMPAGYVLMPGRPMPYGWRKHMRAFPVHVERRMAPLPYGYSRGFIGGRAVIYNRNTSIAIDIASMF